MSVLDMLARAETSSDLQHHDYMSDVYVLGAAGMAACSNPAHMSIFRVKYLNDATELDAAKRLFITWARRVMTLRGIDPSGLAVNPRKTESANRIGVQAFHLWLDDVCHTCHGRRYEVPDGAPSLSDRTCPDCKGSGKNEIKHQHPEVIRDLHERADTAVNAIQAGIDGKLGRRG